MGDELFWLHYRCHLLLRITYSRDMKLSRYLVIPLDGWNIQNERDARTRSTSCTSSCWGAMRPKSLCGRQAAPWLCATQLLCPGFVHPSVLHIWHSLRCCRIWGAPVPAKFWRLTGWTNISPRNFIWSLRCIAFRICMTCYRRKPTVSPGKFFLSKNNP